MMNGSCVEQTVHARCQIIKVSIWDELLTFFIRMGDSKSGMYHCSSGNDS